MPSRTRQRRASRRRWRLAVLPVVAVAVVVSSASVLRDRLTLNGGPVTAEPDRQPNPNPGTDPKPSPSAENVLPDPVTAGPDTTVELAEMRSTRDELRALPAEWPIVRGVYATRHSFAGQKWHELMGLVRETELNSIVIDVKDDWGDLTWRTHVPLGQEAGADSRTGMRDPTPRVRELRRAGGYPIARIVVFKDTRLAEARPDLAILDARTGEIWRDRSGLGWLDPWNRETWEYIAAVSREAAAMGFLEIQYDYIRFPTDGPTSNTHYPSRPPDAERVVEPALIAEFLAYMREQMHGVGVRVSADVFGLITYKYGGDGDGTGQLFEPIAAEVDYLSPMVYPSHYYPGNYGLANPQANPHTVVWNAMRESMERSQGLRAQIRPWLEDFAYRGPHSPERVVAQKQATYENGIESWLLWNAGNNYSIAALEPTLRRHATPVVAEEAETAPDA